MEPADLWRRTDGRQRLGRGRLRRPRHPRRQLGGLAGPAVLRSTQRLAADTRIGVIGILVVRELGD